MNMRKSKLAAGSQALPGSAWEPIVWEARPHEAEPLAQCVPRQSLGTRKCIRVFDSLEESVA